MPHLLETIKKKQYLALPLFLFLCLLLYGGSLQGEFVFDDLHLIVNNAYLKDARLLPRVMTSDIYRFWPLGKTNHYRPLLLTSYALDYSLWQLRPFGYHLTNIILHALNSFLVLVLISRLFGSARQASIAALLFCLHPIHISAVSYISGRADLLVTFFILLSLIHLLTYVNTQRLKKYALSLLFFVLALLSRENALLLPPLAILVMLTSRTDKKNVLLAALGFVVIGCLYCLNRPQLLANTISLLHNREMLLTLPLELLNVTNILRRYAALLVWPWPLFPMRTTPFIQTWNSLNAGFAVLLMLLLVFAVLRTRKGQSVPAFGFFWLLIALLPLPRLMYTLPGLGAAMAEHWLYLPSIGFAAILAAFLRPRQRMTNALMAIVCCLFAILTIIQSKVWKNELTLYKHTIKHAPQNTHVRFNLANVYHAQGNDAEAVRIFKQLLKRDPNLWDAHNQLGNIQYAQGRLDEATASYKQAIKLNPQSAISYYNLGMIQNLKGKTSEAFDSFLKSIRIDPELWLAYKGVGDWHFGQEKYEEAAAWYRKALTLNPEDNPLRVSLGAALGNSGALENAIDVWKYALQRDPANEEIKRNIRLAEELKASTRK